MSKPTDTIDDTKANDMRKWLRDQGMSNKDAQAIVKSGDTYGMLSDNLREWAKKLKKVKTK